MKAQLLMVAALCGFGSTMDAATPDDGSVLPFPPTPRLQDAKMKWPAQPQRLPKDAPNILSSPCSRADFDQAPFKCNGTIGVTVIKYLKK